MASPVSCPQVISSLPDLFLSPNLHFYIPSCLFNNSLKRLPRNLELSTLKIKLASLYPMPHSPPNLFFSPWWMAAASTQPLELGNLEWSLVFSSAHLPFLPFVSELWPLPFDIFLFIHSFVHSTNASIVCQVLGSQQETRQIKSKFLNRQWTNNYKMLAGIKL